MTTLSTSPVDAPLLDARIQRAERMFFTGVIITGTLMLAPIGLPLLGIGGYRLIKLERQRGTSSRPWHALVLGAFAIIDAAGNFIGWSFCIFAAQTGIMWTVFRMGYGLGFDGFYLKDYGSTWLIHGVAGPGEQSYIFMAILVLWPMRLASAWAFLQMKRWGFRFMVTTSWMLVVFWLGWTSNGLMYFDERFGAAGGSVLGIAGWWIFNGVFIFGPVAMIPYLYLVDPKRWNRC
jgi:hypothetical protein